MYKTREEVEKWLKEMKIKNYVINEDLTVDVNDNVDMSYKELKEIPIQFSKVNGYFDCSNNSLISLEGCPQEIKDFFGCDNNKLTKIEYFPQEINGEFIIMNENRIKEEELFNFNCNIENVKQIHSDFNTNGNVKEFFEIVNFYKNIKKESELLKDLSINSNNVKLNKKL